MSYGEHEHMPLGKSDDEPGATSLTLWALEPRYMFDAAGAATGADAAQDAASAAEAEQSSVSSDDTTTGVDETTAALSVHNAPSNRTEIVFVDTSVAGYQDLVSAIGDGAEVVMLDGTQSGLSQISNALKGRTGIDAIHLISHGNVGMVQVGADVLSLSTIEQHQNVLSVIGSALSDSGDILLYGCNVGDDQSGMAFIDALADATGADIAASDDLTGGNHLGGGLGT